jgi:hypothetical protein
MTDSAGMQQERAILATLSEHAYHPDGQAPGRWKLLEKVRDDGSGFQAAAYEHPVTHQVVIAYTGTDEGKDYLTYPGIGSGSSSGIVSSTAKHLDSGAMNRQVDLAHEFADRIKSGHPDANITYTGHSFNGSAVALPFRFHRCGALVVAAVGGFGGGFLVDLDERSEDGILVDRQAGMISQMADC